MDGFKNVLRGLASILAVYSLIYSLHVRAQNAQPIVPRADEKPSFDCSKAKTASARLICADRELARLDGQLGAAFQNRKSQIPATEQQKFVADQVAWIRERNNRCALIGKDNAAIETLAAAKPCMVSAIRDRIVILSQFAQTQVQDNSRPVVAKPPAGQRDAAPTAECDTYGAKNDYDNAFVCWTEYVKVNPQVAIGYLRLGEAYNRKLEYVKAIEVLTEAIRLAPDFAAAYNNRGEAYVKTEKRLAAIADFRTALSLSPNYVAPKTNLVELGEGAIVDAMVASAQAQGLASQVTYKLTGSINCGFTMMCPGCAPGFTPFNEAYFEFGDTSWLLDDSAIDAVLDRVRNEVRNYCEGLRRDSREQRPVFGKFVMHGLSNNGQVILANIDANQSRWNIQFNAIAAQHQAQLQAQRVALTKQALRREVWSNLQYQKLALDGELTANPFIFKDTVVGVQTNFSRMLSENEAIFSMNSEILVSGVPSTMFHGNEMVILAIKVVGTKAVKTPGGEVTLPYGEYVGVYKCVQNGCSEFFE